MRAAVCYRTRIVIGIRHQCYRRCVCNVFVLHDLAIRVGSVTIRDFQMTTAEILRKAKSLICKAFGHLPIPDKRSTIHFPPVSYVNGNTITTLSEISVPESYKCFRCGEKLPSWKDGIAIERAEKP